MKENRSTLRRQPREKSPVDASTELSPAEREAIARKFVWLLAGMAAIRVFVFSAVFPVFNNVDEQFHFDLVVKYSHAEIPRRLVPVSQESAKAIVLYGTPEYFLAPRNYPDGRIPPPMWTFPADVVARGLPSAAAKFASEINHESTEPPLYYALAGLWRQLGQQCGIGRGGGGGGGGADGLLIYWIRFLNPFLAGTLVWVGYFAARLVFPERRVVQLGVPLLLAVFPQDAFYSIQSDVLSALLFGGVFIGVVKWLRTEQPSAALAILTGLALAAAGLTKGANWPLVVVAIAAVLVKSIQLVRTSRGRAVVPATALLSACAVLPVAGWLVRNVVVLGDLTGSAEKAKLLGWTRKPIGDWWNHPLFTPRGVYEFWSELMASFWRGEFVWFGERLASPTMDAFYWLSSLGLLGVTLASLLRGRKVASPAERGGLWLAFTCFAASVIFLATASIAFDFGNCVYPSRAHPFFTSGRLILGSLVPFLILYVYGLDRALGQWKTEWPTFFAVVGIALCVTVSEFKLNSPAFASAYNWFSLLAGRS